MIVYFADRFFNILGQASTNLIDGLTIVDDRKVEDIDSGVSTFEFTIPFSDSTRKDAEAFGAVGNYILRSHNGEQDFFTIIDCEIDTKRQEVTVYAEDAGLDLLNEIVGAYAPAKAHDIAHYVNKFAYDSGFVIGVNEVTGVTKKLAWDDDATAAERIADIAKQFDAEISYSFEIKGLSVTKKLINIYKERGNDVGVQLRLNKELDRIITKTSIANLATALLPEGGTPEDAENPINLSGYTYDDGDIYLEGRYLKSRSAIQKWSRYLNPSEPQTTYTGHILKKYSCDAVTQADLCAEAVAHLKKISDIEVNYNVEFEELPDGVRIGDRVNIVDDSGAIYISARILELETSVANKSQSATIGEYLIKSGGIAQKVADLAEKYAKEAQSTAKAYLAAKKAQEQADAAVKDAANAQETANSAQTAANDAQTSANTAQQAAETAQTASNNAQSAANTAQEKANEAASSAAQAIADAANANAAVTIAQSAAESAGAKAETAQSTAETAKTQAESASTTAAAAKLDAENAQKEIDALGGELETLSNTMSADYARKTDLTEATSSLQTQITQNADTIATHATQITTINETANDAASKAQSAQTVADAAKSLAEIAKSNAATAQTAAENAAKAAENAQDEADAAKTAAATAQSVANKAKQDLETAQSALTAVQSRVDATEEEISAAQTAVTAAQAAADAAQKDATDAANAAATAQSKADAASANAATAQTAADNAKAAADAAQKSADDAQADVDALAVRVTSAETSITQNADQIALRATKQEVTETLAGYYTKTEANAAIQVKANEITSSVEEKFDTMGTRVSTVEQTASGLSVRLEDAEYGIATAQSMADNAQSTANNAKTSANNAAKTATNFLSYGENGLEIGDNRSGSWNGYRTQVNSSSFNILDAGGKKLATYGADSIHLGYKKDEAAANSATIFMCDDDLQIMASSYNDFTYSELYSPRIVLRADDSAGFNVSKILYDGESGKEEQHEVVFQGYQPGTNPSHMYDYLEAELKVSSRNPGSEKLDFESKIVLQDRYIEVKSSGGISLTCGSDCNIFLDGETAVKSGLDVKNGQIELNRNGSAGDNGGYIDFHYGMSTADYTSRIIEDGEGKLSVTAPNGLYVNKSKVMTASDIKTGTWTASLNGGSITKQYCTYMKVRNMCSISFYITGTGGTGTAATNFYISGAPYSPNSSATWYGGGCHVQGLYDTANYPVTGCVIHPNKRIYIRTAQVGGTGTGYVRVNNGGATFHLAGSITYPIA